MIHCQYEYPKLDNTLPVMVAYTEWACIFVWLISQYWTDNSPTHPCWSSGVMRCYVLNATIQMHGNDIRCIIVLRMTEDINCDKSIWCHKHILALHAFAAVYQGYTAFLNRACNLMLLLFCLRYQFDCSFKFKPTKEGGLIRDHRWW